MGQKFGGLDSADRAFHQMSKLLALFVGDGSAKVLDLDESPADKDYLSDIGDTRYPGVATSCGSRDSSP